MSLKSFFMLVLCASFFVSCKKERRLRYENLSSLTDEEKDSLTKIYDQFSVYFLQPSEIHRIYKDSALMIQPENVEIRQRYSYSFKKVGDHIKAMEILNKAVEIDTARGEVGALEYKVWTLLYYYRDYEGTIKDVDLIEEMTGKQYNPCWGEPCGFHKGQALYRLGRYKEAIKAFEIVDIEEEKMGFETLDNYMMHFYMGRCYAELLEYDKAMEYYNLSLKSVEKFPEAYYQMGLVCKKRNDTKNANNYFKLAEKYIRYKMGEPFIERFDEVFPYMVEKELNK